MGELSSTSRLLANHKRHAQVEYFVTPRPLDDFRCQTFLQRRNANRYVLASSRGNCGPNTANRASLLILLAVEESIVVKGPSTGRGGQLHRVHQHRRWHKVPPGMSDFQHPINILHSEEHANAKRYQRFNGKLLMR